MVTVSAVMLVIKVITGKYIKNNKEQDLSETDIEIEEQCKTREIKYHPFTFKELEEFLKGSCQKMQILAYRQQQLMENMRIYKHTTRVDGLTLNEWIETYAFGSNSLEKVGSSGNHYDPDTLYKQWEKIYRQYEMQGKRYIHNINRVVYEQMLIERVNECIELLPVPERNIIVCVYVNHESIKKYCLDNHIGYSQYRRIRKSAFDRLIRFCNNSLRELNQIWEKDYEKTAVDFFGSLPASRELSGSVGV